MTARDPMAPRARAGERTKLSREIVTPEGVAINFELAALGERATAFLLDAIVMFAALVGISLVFSIAGASSELLKPIMTVLAFVVFNFYFAFFEIRWQGQTPGKRAMRIRVIDARGGQLETQAVLARNLVRQLETWMPLEFLIAFSWFSLDYPRWTLLLAGLWLLVLLLLPALNKDKLRVGDIIGGTRVVQKPKVVLVPDLAAAGMESMERRAQARPTFTFTDEQLGVYGIYELQVLEDVLRQDPSKPSYYDAISTVCDKIREKIKYEPRIESSERFLKDFYAALRAHLEQKMLFGQRKADKFAK